eukprot:14845853-Ditylum_brightwellii.AAC.1
MDDGSTVLAFGVGIVISGILGGSKIDVSGDYGALGGGQYQLMLDVMCPSHLLLGLGNHVPTIPVCQYQQLPLWRAKELRVPGFLWTIACVPGGVNGCALKSYCPKM